MQQVKSKKEHVDVTLFTASELASFHIDQTKRYLYRINKKDQSAPAKIRNRAYKYIHINYDLDTDNALLYRIVRRPRKAKNIIQYLGNGDYLVADHVSGATLMERVYYFIPQKYYQ